MVIIVTFFKQAIEMEYKTPLDVLYLALAAFGISLALYFTHREYHGK